MSRLYDPISQTVLEKEDFPEPSSLQGLCRKSIIQAVTLGDIEKVIYIVQLGQLLKIWWRRECPPFLTNPKIQTKIALSVIVIFL